MISANVSDEDQHHTTTDLTFFGIRYSTADMINSLQGLRVDHLGALAVSTRRFDVHNYIYAFIVW